MAAAACPTASAPSRDRQRNYAPPAPGSPGIRRASAWGARCWTILIKISVDDGAQVGWSSCRASTTWKRREHSVCSARGNLDVWRSIPVSEGRITRRWLTGVTHALSAAGAIWLNNRDHDQGFRCSRPMDQADGDIYTASVLGAAAIWFIPHARLFGAAGRAVPQPAAARDIPVMHSAPQTYLRLY